MRNWRPTLSELLILQAVAAIAVLVGLPALRSSIRLSNTRSAGARLKTMATAEADFRANDADGNGAADFWVRDVYGLYGLRGTNGAPIALIEARTAAADVTGLAPTPAMAPPSRPWEASDGYVMRAFGGYETAMGTTDYGERNWSKFAFLALPVSHGRGCEVFMIEETITIRRFCPGESYWGVYRGGWRPAAEFECEFPRSIPYPASPGIGSRDRHE